MSYRVDVGTTAPDALFMPLEQGMQSRGGPFQIIDRVVVGDNPIVVGEAACVTEDGIESIITATTPPRGIVVFSNVDPKILNTDPPSYAPGMLAAMITSGCVQITAGEDVKAGDDVIIIKATGKFSGTSAGAADGTARIALPGAYWLNDVNADEKGEINIK